MIAWAAGEGGFSVPQAGCRDVMQGRGKKNEGRMVEEGRSRTRC